MRRNSLVSPVEFLGLIHTFATVSPSNITRNPLKNATKLLLDMETGKETSKLLLVMETGKETPKLLLNMETGKETPTKMGKAVTRLLFIHAVQ